MADGEARTGRWVDGPAGRLRVEDVGSGAVPVVFVHALAGARGQWEPQVRHLRATRRVVALDLRGHGESEPSRRGAYSLPDLAADVAAVADSLKLDRFVLVGHSLGGGVAAAYAAAHAERLAGLLFVDPIGDQRQAREEILAFVERLRTGDYRRLIRAYWESILQNGRPRVKQRVLADLDATPRQAVIRGFEASVEFDPVGPVSVYEGPKRALITPLNDFTFSLHRLVDDLPAETMEGTSHWPQLDRPGEFNRLLDEFLLTIEAPGS